MRYAVVVVTTPLAFCFNLSTPLTGDALVDGDEETSALLPQAAARATTEKSTRVRIFPLVITVLLTSCLGLKARGFNVRPAAQSSKRAEPRFFAETYGSLMHHYHMANIVIRPEWH